MVPWKAVTLHAMHAVLPRRFSGIKNVFSRWLPVALDIFSAIAEMKLAPSSHIGPSDSTATGMKWCVPEICR